MESNGYDNNVVELEEGISINVKDFL